MTLHLAFVMSQNRFGPNGRGRFGDMTYRGTTAIGQSCSSQPPQNLLISLEQDLISAVKEVDSALIIIAQMDIIFHVVHATFNLIATACFATVANFQAKWGVGPTALSALAVVVSTMGLALALYCIVRFIYGNPTDPHSPLEQLMEARHGAIFGGLMACCYGAIALATTISAFTQPGCRNRDDDPHADLKKVMVGPDVYFRDGLPAWCSTKKAGSIFLCVLFVRWLHAFSIGAAGAYRDWRNARERARARAQEDLPRFREPDIQMVQAMAPVPGEPLHGRNDPPNIPLRNSLFRASEPAHTAIPQRRPSRNELLFAEFLPQHNQMPIFPVFPPEPALEARPRSFPQQPLPFCNICRESVQVEQSIRTLTCLHIFCTECIQGHVRAQLAQNLFPIECPDCVADLSNRERTNISLAQVEGLLTDAEKERWWTLELAPFALEVQCPWCHRSALLDREEYSRVGTLDCPLPDCETRFCKFCMQVLTDLSLHTCDGSAEFERLVTQRDWKRCPGPCRAVVEHDGGCLHMTCRSPGCNTHWCYGCGELITRSRNSADAVTQHYEENNCVQFPA